MKTCSQAHPELDIYHPEGHPEQGNLDGAKLVHSSALRQMNEKGIEALMESSDYLESQLRSAYYKLVDKIGRHRTNEIISTFQ